MSSLISLDPGRSKCGLILVDLKMGEVLDGKIVKIDCVIDLICAWQKRGDVKGVLLGNGTNSAFFHQKLLDLLPVTLCEERGTTLRARKRYYELWPPSNLLRLLPKGLLLPPDNLDAIAALVLMEDFLGKKLLWTNKPMFKSEL